MKLTKALPLVLKPLIRNHYFYLCLKLLSVSITGIYYGVICKLGVLKLLSFVASLKHILLGDRQAVLKIICFILLGTFL